MAENYDVRIKIVSLKGHCGAGHKVGDEWLVTSKTPEGICLSAFNSLIPYLRTLQFGGTFPWGNDPDSSLVACPDAANPVVFELRRMPKSGTI
jgi:uncharacterized repeat protein (TIGR04076 family)